MAKEKKESGVKPPAPWVLTFGDMMSQILCFFIILFSISDIKQEKLVTAMRSIQTAFNMQVDFPRENIIGETKEFKQALQQLVSNRNKGKTDKREAAIVWPKGGEEVKVMFVREGLKVTIGGRASFKKGSADIEPLMKKRLQSLSEALKGYRYRIEVRGHASREPFGSDEAKQYGPDAKPGDYEGWYHGKWNLGYARARAVAEYMSENGGIKPARIRICSSGDTDPLKSSFSEQLDYENLLNRNRRVEIIVTEEEIPMEHERLENQGGGR